MKNLIYKELKLAVPFSIIFFLIGGISFVIPNYPIWVTMVYPLMSVNLYLSLVKYNKDFEFTALLPIKREQSVALKLGFIYMYQIIYILFSIPFTIMSAKVTNINGNFAAIDPSVGVYAVWFLAFAVFNLIALPDFFKTGGHKYTKNMILGYLALFSLTICIEILVINIKTLNRIYDTAEVKYLVYQIPTLLVGIAAFVGAGWLTYKRSLRGFDKVVL